ncbi:unnamed protein product, partial [Effrenium voratum]
TVADRANKRSSLLAAVSAVAEKSEKSEKVEKRGSEAFSRGNLGGTASLASLMSNIVEGNAKAHANQKKRADEVQQMREAERDWSIPIPDLYLARMRVDLGVRSSKDQDTSSLRSIVVGEEAKARRRSIAHNLLAEYGRGAEMQKQSRSEREAEMLQRLQPLVPEAELQGFRKEFAILAQDCRQTSRACCW